MKSSQKIKYPKTNIIKKLKSLINGSNNTIKYTAMNCIKTITKNSLNTVEQLRIDKIKESKEIRLIEIVLYTIYVGE